MLNFRNWFTIIDTVPQTAAVVIGGINVTVRSLGNSTAVAVAAALFHWHSGDQATQNVLLHAHRATMTPAAVLAAPALAPTLF